MKKNRISLLVALLVLEGAAVLILLGMAGTGAKYTAAACAVAAGITAFYLSGMFAAKYKEAIRLKKQEQEEWQKQFTGFQTELLQMIGKNEESQKEQAAAFKACMDSGAEIFIKEFGQAVAAMETGYGNAAEKLSGAMRGQMRMLADTLQEGLAQLKKESETMDRHYEQTLTDLRNVSAESYQNMSKKLQEYGQSMEERLTGVSNANTQQLVQAGSDMVRASVQSLCENNGQMLVRQSDLFEKHLTKTSEKYDEILTDCIQSLEEYLEGQLSHAEEVNRNALMENADCIRQLTGAQDAFTETARQAHDTLRHIIKECFENYQTAAAETTGEFEQRLAVVHEKSREWGRTQLEEFAKQNAAFTSGLARAIDTYTQALVDKSAQAVAAVQKDNNLKLQEMSEGIARMAEADRQFVADSSAYTKASSQQIDLLAAQGKDSLKAIDTLTAQSRDSLKAFDSSREWLDALIQTEKTFLADTGKNNDLLRDVIKGCFASYTQAVIKTVDELEEKLAGNTEKNRETIQEMEEKLSASYEKNKDWGQTQLDGFAKLNSAYAFKLTEALQGYSDTLVEKSAQAVAAVQKDNNLKLQAMSEEIAHMAEENRRFVADSTQFSKIANSQIGAIATRNEEMVEKLRKAGMENIDGLSGVLGGYLNRLQQQLDEHSNKNVRQFSNSMDDYRERFVQANAAALADVQISTVQSIENANDKVAELAEKLKETNRSILGLSHLQNQFLAEMKETNEEQRETQEEFADQIGDKLDDAKKAMAKSIEKELDEYNELFKQLAKKIDSVTDSVKKNTDEYRQTLKHIKEGQLAMNSLTQKDIQLMERLVK